MVKCATEKCSELVVARVFWPGQERALLMCQACGLRATAVARAMGFSLPVEALEIPQVLTHMQLFG
jgi:hypothetical protein